MFDLPAVQDFRLCKSAEATAEELGRQIFDIQNAKKADTVRLKGEDSQSAEWKNKRGTGQNPAKE